MALALRAVLRLAARLGATCCASLVIIPLVMHGITLISGCSCGRSRSGSCCCVLPYRVRAGEGAGGAVQPADLHRPPGRTAAQLRPAAVRRRRHGGRSRWSCRSASRSTSCASCRRRPRANRAPLVGRGAGGRAGLDRAGRCSRCWAARLLAFLALQHEVPMEQAMRADAACTWPASATCFRDPAWVLGAVTAVRRGVADEDQHHQCLCRLAGLVQLLRAADPQPSGARGVAGVQRADRGAADGRSACSRRWSMCWACTRNVAIAWVGALVADLVISKPLGLSPPHVEFRRAHLYDVNPVGVGAMLIASVLSMASLLGVFGRMAQAMAALHRARQRDAGRAADRVGHEGPLLPGAHRRAARRARPDAAVRGLRKPFRDATTWRPARPTRRTICSLCCSLDARCHDRCKTDARLSDQCMGALNRLLPNAFTRGLKTRVGHYLVVMALTSGVIVTMLGLLYYEELANLTSSAYYSQQALRGVFIKLFSALLLLTGIGVWWLVLTSESRSVAQQESERQTNLLLQEIEAHKQHRHRAAARQGSGRSGQPGQEPLCDRHEPRAAHAAEQHPRLCADPARPTPACRNTGATRSA